MTSGRRLDSRDVGRVFVRVDSNGKPGEYLYLWSLGPDPTGTASFITFRVVDGAAQDVGTTGHHNGSWYQEVPEFSEPFLADIRARHDQQVEEWRIELERRVAESAELRARLGKPESWSPLGEGRTGGRVSEAYVIWYNSDTFTYEIEVYGPADQLLDAGLGLMLSLACLGLFGAPATVGAQQASVMVEENVCEGEWCSKVEGLRASAPIGIYRDDALTSGIAFFVDAGEELTVVATNLHHDPPGLVVMVAPHEVAHAMDGSRLRLEVGDTVRILGYRGEGYFGFLWRGGAYEAEAFWPVPFAWPFRTDTPGRLIHPAHTHTWHQVRTADGRFGWVLSDPVVLEYFGDF